LKFFAAGLAGSDHLFSFNVHRCSHKRRSLLLLWCKASAYGYMPVCHIQKTREDFFKMAKIRVYKRNPTFVDLTELIEEISNIGLT